MGIEIGQVIDGKYRVTARIGEGGMGAVYSGEHMKLHRRVAIKVLHASAAGDPEMVTRFEREAQAAGRIGNDHILEVLDIGQLPGGDRYMVMEFLDGEPMDARLLRVGRATPRQLYPLARQMLEGLAAAHSAGIVHRDLKPANIFILREKAGQPDYVKIIDFGISKFRSFSDEAHHHQTRTGTIIGSPSYMSPEQARGLREADARSDIYAIGVILYEAVTGRCPFEGASTNDLLFKIFLNEPPAIETLTQDVDPAFCTLVMKALSKDPNDRFARAEDFIAALDAWAQSGLGVSVVKRPEMAATMLERPSEASRPLATGGAEPATFPATQGSWAGSRPFVAGVPKTQSARITVIVLAVAVLGVGVGGFLLAKGGRRVEAAPSSATAPPAAAPSVVPTRIATRLPEPPPAPAAAALPQAKGTTSASDAGAVAATPEAAATHRRGHAAPSPAPAAPTPPPKRSTDPLDQL